MKRLSFLVVFIFISFYLLASPAVSATYYVSWSSGDDSNDGKSPNNPWRSLNKASFGPNEGYQGGDVIAFKKGDTWDMGDPSNNVGPVDGITRLAIRIPRSGLTYTNYGTGALPKFYGHRSTLNTGESCAGIYQPSSTYSFTIDGIAFDNMGWGWNDSNNDYRNSAIITTIAKNSKVTNCTFNDMYNGFNFNSEGTDWTAGNYNEISYNTITNIKHSGIYSFHGADAYTLIKGNSIDNCSYNGIDIVGRRNNLWRIQGNYISGSNNAIEFSGSSYNEVFSNILCNNHTIAGKYANSLGGIALVQGASYHKIYNNTFYKNDYGMVFQSQSPNCDSCSDLTCLQTNYCMINNEFKNNISIGGIVAEVFIYSEAQRVRNTFEYNLYYTPGGTLLRFTQSGGQGSGLQTASWWTSYVDPHGIYANPNLKDTSNLPDGLDLVLPSAAIAYGINLGSNYQIDFYGATRSGEKWDLGAITSNTKDTMIPSQPVNLRIMNN